jgi:hypothetical protein
MLRAKMNKSMRVLLRQVMMAGIGLIGLGIGTAARADEVETSLNSVLLPALG